MEGLDDILIGLDNSCRTAMRDISEYILTEKISIGDRHNDYWYMTPNRMMREPFNKEISRMNEELGLHKINKFGKRMIRH